MSVGVAGATSKLPAGATVAPPVLSGGLMVATTFTSAAQPPWAWKPNSSGVPAGPVWSVAVSGTMLQGSACACDWPGASAHNSASKASVEHERNR